VLIVVDSIYNWQSVLAETVDICRPLLKDQISFFVAPVRLERIVSSFAVKVITNIFPDDTVREWPNLPLAVLDERVTTECRRGLEALTEISGIIASVRGNELHDEEAAALKAALQQVNETLRFFDELIEETNHPLIAEISGALLELDRQVEDEAAAVEAGTPVAHGFAASVISGLRGEANDIFSTYIGMITACVDYDIDPSSAWDRFQEALRT
jgi:hypothetical protein